MAWSQAAFPALKLPFHYGRTRIGGRGRREEEGIAKPENRFACRRKTLTLQRRKSGAEKVDWKSMSLKMYVVSTTERANTTRPPNHVEAMRNAILRPRPRRPVLSIFLETQRRFARVFYKYRVAQKHGFENLTYKVPLPYYPVCCHSSWAKRSPWTGEAAVQIS